MLVRAAALSVEFYDLVRDLFGGGQATAADDFSRNILFDLAHAQQLFEAHVQAVDVMVSDVVMPGMSGPDS